MTELSPAATISPDGPIDSMRDFQGTSGVLLAGTEGKIVDAATGEDLPFHKEGELLIRGPQVMLGYFNNPKVRRRPLDLH
jgi:long-subunit acyl-CoA synthetase (AMP-forming)